MSIYKQYVSEYVVLYTRKMPKLWNKTIEAHRREVRDAILETTVALVAKHGLLSVTMSQIAEETGIGRATLYKYFSGVEAILVAWHERHVNDHLEHLAQIGDQGGTAGERLEAVLEAYAVICFGRHSTELAALLHRDEHIARAQKQLSDLISNLLTEAAEASDVRTDVPPDELASYCLHALATASSLPSEAAVRRLVKVTLTGCAPAPSPTGSRTTTTNERCNMCDEHIHDTPHAHEHERGGEKPSHPHTGHEYDGDAHEHPQAHEAGLEDAHEHEQAGPDVDRGEQEKN